MTTQDHTQPLRSPKQERFAKNLSRGMGPSEAYAAAGYSTQGAHIPQAAWKARQKPHVRARIAFLQQRRAAKEEKASERAIERTSLTKEWVISRTKEVVDRCLQARVLCGPNGKPILVEGPGGEAHTMMAEFQPREALRGLELLGRELAVFTKRHDHTHTLQKLEAMTPEERAADARAVMNEARAFLANYRNVVDAEERGDVTDADYLEIPTAPASKGEIGR